MNNVLIYFLDGRIHGKAWSTSLPKVEEERRNVEEAPAVLVGPVCVSVCLRTWCIRLTDGVGVGGAQGL